jgi:hypothetical protein
MGATMSSYRSTLSALPVVLACTMQALAQTPPRPPTPPLVVITPPAPSTKAGLLTCNTSPSIGFVVGGRQSLACQFMPIGPYPPESYTGEITTVGLDIGTNSGGALIWAVFMPTRGAQYGSLAGKYGGVTGNVSLGIGAGANLLVGGSDRSITLQPFSVDGSTGINLAVGVSGLVLRLVEPGR